MSKPEESKDEIIAQLREENRLLREKNELLEKKVDYLLRRFFGKKSEQLDPAQLELLFNELDGKKSDDAGCDTQENEDAPVAELQKELRVVTVKKTKGLKFPKNIHQVLTEIIPEEVKKHPEHFRRIGERRTSKLDHNQSFYTEHITVRGVWVEIEDSSSFHVAALPASVLPGSVLSPSLLAGIITGKYCDHLPLYRQAQIMQRRYGINIARNTLSDWMEVGADWLTPLWKLHVEDLRSSGYIKADETPIDYLFPGNGQVKAGKLWVFHNPQLNTIVYDWHTGRSSSCLGRVLGEGENGFRGILQSDGYEGYGKWAREHPQIYQMGCWAHVRRKFYDCLKEAPGDAAKILRLIQHLYRIEKEVANSPPELKRHRRQKQSRPIILKLYRLIAKAKKRHRPQSDMGKAAAYALGQWNRLIVYLHHGQVDIDNNSCERGVRPTKIGAKNWLFIGGADTGWRSAVLYTMVENCKLLGKDPYAYLKWVFEKLPTMTNQDDMRKLTPASWVETLEEAEKAVA